MGKPGLAEILVVLLIVLLLFGAKRLPDMARSLGRSMRIFKSEVKELRQDDAAHPDDVNDEARRESASPRGIEGRIVEPGAESPRVTATEPSDRDR